MPESRTSVLDNKVNRLFNYPLTIKQQIWLHYVIPGLSSCTIYILNFSLDLGVALALLNHCKIASGSATVCLMYLPAAILYLRQITEPPLPKNFKTRTKWILTETSYVILFPLRLMKHLGEKLFWLIEILKHDDKIEENLCNYETSSTEPVLTYMFIMIFLQNIPQALLQIYLLARGTTNSNSINTAQSICALVSLLIGSIGVASYHRYESQVIAGRPPVWPTKPNKNHNTTGCQSQPLVPTQQTNWHKGLQDETPAGKCLLTTFWFLFLLGRTLVIGIMLNFYPKIVLIISNLHVILFFIYYSTYVHLNIFHRFFLSCVSIFIIIEVGVKFNRTVYLYMLFIVSSLAEDVGFTIIWYVWGGWQSPWFNYAAYTVINCHLLALIVFAYYMAFKQPRTIYIRNRISE